MHQARKRFGQNFLVDQSVIEKIIAVIGVRPLDHFVEIGPGQGALTFPLLEKIKHLDVIELDRDLIPLLQMKNKFGDALKIQAADALNFDFAKLKMDDRQLRIVGNLPYNISTPLLFHLLDYAAIIEDMVFMLQKEVAERLAATPGTKQYGRLSVMVQYHAQVEIIFDVPPTAFNPAPQVTSSILRITPYQTLPIVALDEEMLATIVRQAFGHRRKTLRNSLKDLMTDSLWVETGINPELRAENLDVAAFIKLANAVATAKAL